MLALPAPLLRQIADAAEAAWPEECCGLLVGRGRRVARVTRIAPSPNLAAGSGDRFEIDPGLRFRLMRELAAAGGDERILGHYHSHPDHPAEPSARDLAMALEPDLLWLIVAVSGGQVIHAAAHRLDPAAGRFRPVALRILAPAETT